MPSVHVNSARAPHVLVTAPVMAKFVKRLITFVNNSVTNGGRTFARQASISAPRQCNLSSVHQPTRPTSSALRDNPCDPTGAPVSTTKAPASRTNPKDFGL